MKSYLKSNVSAIVLVMFLNWSITGYAQDYHAYVKKEMSAHGLTLSFPEQMIMMLMKEQVADRFTVPFYFNQIPSGHIDEHGFPIYEDIVGMPIVDVEAAVFLDEKCHAYLINIDNSVGLTKINLYAARYAHWSVFTPCLLFNCDARMDITVQDNNTKRKSRKLLRAYISEITDSVLLGRVNSSSGAIVRFPNVHLISCGNVVINKYIHKNTVTCYGVEFREDQAASERVVTILLFIQDGGSCINDYVEQLSHFIHFNPEITCE